MKISNLDKELNMLKSEISFHFNLCYSFLITLTNEQLIYCKKQLINPQAGNINTDMEECQKKEKKNDRQAFDGPLVN